MVHESAGGVVLNQKGQILVVNQNGNSWSLPKGHLDSGEDALSAARREIHEESGISDLVFVKRLGTYERTRIGLAGVRNPKERKRITLFLFTTSQNKLAPLDPQNPEARWVDRSRVAELLTHPKDKAYFLSLLKKLPKEGKR